MSQEKKTSFQQQMDRYLNSGSRPPSSRGKHTAIKLRDLVIPAQAGIHPRLELGAIREIDPRLRGDDSLSLTYWQAGKTKVTP